MQKGRVIKSANSLLEDGGAKKLPPHEPAKLEAIISSGASPGALKAIQEGIEAVKHRVHFEKEALDPEGRLGVE